MSKSTPQQDDEDEPSVEESWRLIAQEYDGEPAGEIAKVMLQSSTEDTIS